jgi:putative tryptophan/tyrosine transport system substrate-binding protein
MRRREFVTLFGGAAAMLPFGVRAQETDKQVRRVGALMVWSEGDVQGEARLTALVDKLRELGWTKGRNLSVDVRWTAPNMEGIRTEAKELVALQPELIVAGATPAVIALAHETHSIPIVFVSVSDPIGSGLVADLAHPGGHITGFTAFEFSVGGKWLQTIKEAAPDVSRAGVLFNPATAPYARNYMKFIETAATALAVNVIELPVGDPTELERAVKTTAIGQNAALIVMNDIFTAANRERIISLAGSLRLPTIYPYRFFADAGGLISYGAEPIELYQRAAAYADKILRGAKPGDLPIQQPVKYELVVNLKTAQALGLNVSASLLARADEVIE